MNESLTAFGQSNATSDCVTELLPSSEKVGVQVWRLQGSTQCPAISA